MFILVILSRWIHVISACLVIGGVFFIRFLLPFGTGKLEPEVGKQVFLKCRRAFKMVVHSAILLLVITGTVNTSRAWDKYSLNPPLMHPIWGIHLLLGLIIFGIALYLLAGAEPPANHRKLIAINFVLMLLAVAAASTLKWAREKTVADHPIPLHISETR